MVEREIAKSMPPIKYRRRQGVLTQRVAALQNHRTIVAAFEAGALGEIDTNEPVMMIGRLGILYRLNLSAAIIWESFADPSSVHLAAATLSQVQAVSPFKALEVTERFVNFLVEKCLIEEAPDSNSGEPGAKA